MPKHNGLTFAERRSHTDPVSQLDTETSLSTSTHTSALSDQLLNAQNCPGPAATTCQNHGCGIRRSRLGKWLSSSPPDSPSTAGSLPAHWVASRDPRSQHLSQLHNLSQPAREMRRDPSTLQTLYQIRH